jgi:hypothetical protein
VQLACANVVYLYGPRAPSRPAQKMVLWTRLDERLAAKLPEWVQSLTPLPPNDGLQDDLPRNPCPAGEAVKPIPPSEGGNGRWDCRPVVPFVTLQDQARGDSQAGAAADAPESADHFETIAKEVSALIAGAIAPQAGAQLSAEDRATCTVAAYAGVLAMMKGGPPPVPPVCRSVVAAARAEFAYFANNSLYSGSRGVDQLLALVAIMYPTGGLLGAPPAGLTGHLEPTAEDRRQADCIVAGGTLDACAPAKR